VLLLRVEIALQPTLKPQSGLVELPPLPQREISPRRGGVVLKLFERWRCGINAGIITIIDG